MKSDSYWIDETETAKGVQDSAMAADQLARLSDELQLLVAQFKLA